MRIAVQAGCCVTKSLVKQLRHHSKTVLQEQNPLCAKRFSCAKHSRPRADTHRRSFRIVPQASAASIFGASQLPSMLQAFLSPAALAFTILSTVAISAWTSARRKTRFSEITTQPNDFNKGVLSRCPTVNSQYQAWPFLTNGHVETIFASKTRRSPPVEYDRYSFGCPNGGTVHLDYHRLPSSIVGSIRQLFQSVTAHSIGTAPCTANCCIAAGLASRCTGLDPASWFDWGQP